MNSQSVLINSDSLKYIQNRIAEQQSAIDSLTKQVESYNIFDNVDGIITFGGLVLVMSIWHYLSQFKGDVHNRYLR